MTDPTNLDAVLLGGKLALAGASIPAIFVFVDHWRERLSRKRAVLREKYEELASALNDTVEWFYTLDGCRTHEDILATHPSRAGRRIASLAMIYFPKIREDAYSYTDGLVEYYEWMANYDKMDGEFLGIKVADDPEFKIRLDAVQKLRRTLEDSITKHAKTYIRG